MKYGENDLRALKDALSGPETMPERRERERRSRLRDDGRSGRPSQPYRELNTKIPPEYKARLVSLCRRKDMFIRDFVLECLDMGFAKYDPE